MSPRRPEWWPAALDRLEECTWEFLPEVAVSPYQGCLLRVRALSEGLLLELGGPEPELLHGVAHALRERFSLPEWRMCAEDTVGLSTVAGPGKLSREALVAAALHWRPDLSWRMVGEEAIEATTPEGLVLHLSAHQIVKVREAGGEDSVRLHGTPPAGVLGGVAERMLRAATPVPPLWLLPVGVSASTLAAFLCDGPWLMVAGVTGGVALCGTHLLSLPMGSSTRTKLEILLLVVQAVLGTFYLWGAA